VVCRQTPGPVFKTKEKKSVSSVCPKNVPYLCECKINVI
jgi:hypothetical protein